MKQTKPYQNLRVDRNSIINLEKGKIPPQAIDLEEVVLGAMMIDKKGVDEVIDILNSEAFYKESHQYIFEAILTLFENSEPIDLLTVSSQLKKKQ
jgi:replicative DNA helicase